MRARRFLAVATALASGRAVAEPAPTVRVDLARCGQVDAAAARRAIDAELTIPASQRARLGDVAVVITCPDETTAIVAVTPAPPDGPLEKRVELDEVPAELRLRLLALVTAELVAVAVGVHRTTEATPPPAPAPAVVAPPVVAPTAPGSRAVRIDRRRGLLGGDASDLRAFARAGARIFLEQRDVMPEISIGAARGPFAIDAFATTSATNDRLGRVRGTIVGLGVGVAVGCRGGAGTWVCLGARAAAGLAAVSATPALPAIAGHDSMDPYAEAGPRLDVRIEGRRWSGELALAAAWSTGPSVLAQDRDLMRMAGPVLAGTLAVGWSP